MPSPRATLADIIKFKLDPKKPHKINKKNLVNSAPAISNKLSAQTSKEVISEVVVESSPENVKVDIVVDTINPENQELQVISVNEEMQNNNVDQIVENTEKVELENSKNEPVQAFQSYKKRSKKNNIM